MKNERQEKLLKIIAEESIETQEQLLQRLEAWGVKSTQATISRDIKALHLIKEPTGRGTYRYTVPMRKPHLTFANKLRNIFCECVLSVDHAQNIVVLKTMPGLANAAASALDSMENAEIVGSIAGDDTVFMVMRDAESAFEICLQMREQLQ